MADNNHVYHGTYLLSRSERGGHHIRTCLVTANGSLLPISAASGLKRPTSYDWLPSGPGPAALAYTLLANEYGPGVAAALYHDFERDVIAYLPASQSVYHWELTSDQIQMWRQMYGEVQSLQRRLEKFAAKRAGSV